MRRALCAVAALAAMTFVPPAVRGNELPAASGAQDVPVKAALYQTDEQGSNVRVVDYRYRYGSPGYRYGYRYPSYGYQYGYRYPTYYNYPYRSYNYGYRSPSYGYGYPGYGYPDYGYRYGYRPGVSFGFRL